MECKKLLTALAGSILIINTLQAQTLQALDDSEMSESTGQALLYMGVTNGNTISSEYNNFKYYKMGFQADIEANLNIKTLQLGCGGVNGAGACDIDIENLSLTGVPTSIKADGTPQWNYSGAMNDNNTQLANERAASSAVLRNPFIEFALKGDSLSTREIAGVRLSADGIKGFMTAGTNNDTATTNTNKGGINTFSGYIITDVVQAAAKTAETKFGTTEDQKIYAPVYVFLDKAEALGIPLTVNLKARRTAYTDVDAMKPGGSAGTPTNLGFNEWGIKINPLAVNFDFPQTVVTGNRMSQLNLKVDNVPINQIVVSAADGPIYMALDRTVQAGVAGTIAGFDEAITNSTFFMGKSGTRSLTVQGPSVHAGLSATAQQENLRLARILFDKNYANNTSTNEENNIRAAYASLAGLNVNQLPADLNGTLTAQQQQWLLTAAENHMGCVAGGSGGGISVNAGSCTSIDNLTANVTVKQNFTRMHNLPVAKAQTTGVLNGVGCTQTKPCYDFNKGFYLGLQKQAMRWPGSNSDDIAQRGWWMSFSEPLNFGRLEVQKAIDMQDVLPQVSTFINNFFSQQATDSNNNPLYAISGEDILTGPNNNSIYPNWDPNSGNVRLDYTTTTNKNAAGILGAVPKNQAILGPQSALLAAKGLPLYIPLGSINVQGVPAVMELSDLPLSNYQAVVPNCWGNLKFC